MNKHLRFTIVFGLAAAGLGLAASGDNRQSRSDDAAVREAVRFERAKDAAGRRQLRQAPGANRSEADRSSADRVTDEGPTSNAGSSKSEPATAAEALRYERSKDAAAARQMKKDAKKQ